MLKNPRNSLWTIFQITNMMEIKDFRNFTGVVLAGPSENPGIA
jgi:hypothetical protein